MFNPLKNNQNTINMKDSLIKAALIGGVGSIASMVLMGEYRNVNAFGMSIPAGLLVFFGVGVGSLAADRIHDMVLPFIPNNKVKYQKCRSCFAWNGISWQYHSWYSKTFIRKYQFHERI